MVNKDEYIIIIHPVFVRRVSNTLLSAAWFSRCTAPQTTS